MANMWGIFTNPQFLLSPSGQVLNNYCIGPIPNLQVYIFFLRKEKDFDQKKKKGKRKRKWSRTKLGVHTWLISSIMLRDSSYIVFIGIHGPSFVAFVKPFTLLTPLLQLTFLQWPSILVKISFFYVKCSIL